MEKKKVNQIDCACGSNEENRGGINFDGMRMFVKNCKNNDAENKEVMIYLDPNEIVDLIKKLQEVLLKECQQKCNEY